MKETGFFRLNFAMSARESSLCSTALDEGKPLTYLTFAAGIYCHLWCAHGMSSQAEHRNYMWITLLFLHDDKVC